MDPDYKPPAVLTAVLLAVLGGTARQMHEWLSNRRAFTWRHLVARAIVSTFIGFLFFQLAQIWKPEYAPVICPLGGWMGSEAVTLLFSFIAQRARLASEPPREP